MSLLRQLVIAQHASCFGMLQDDYVSREDVGVCILLALDLTVADDLPLVEVGAHIGFVVLEQLVWVWFSWW